MSLPPRLRPPYASTRGYWSSQPQAEAKQQQPVATSSFSSALPSSSSSSLSSPSLYTAPPPPTAVRQRDNFLARKPVVSIRKTAAAATNVSLALPLPPLLPRLAPQSPPPAHHQPLYPPSHGKPFASMSPAQYIHIFSSKKLDQTNSIRSTAPPHSPLPQYQRPVGVKYVTNPPTLSSVPPFTPPASVSMQPFISTRANTKQATITLRSNFIPAVQPSIESNLIMSAPTRIVPTVAATTAPTTTSSTFAPHSNSSSTSSSSSQAPPLAAIRPQAREGGEEIVLIERPQTTRATLPKHVNSSNNVKHSSKSTNFNTILARASTPTDFSSLQQQQRQVSPSSFSRIKKEEAMEVDGEAQFSSELPMPRCDNKLLSSAHMQREQETAARTSSASPSRAISSISSKKQASHAWWDEKKEKEVEEDNDDSAEKPKFNNEHSSYSLSRLLNPCMQEEVKRIPYDKCKVKKRKDVSSTDATEQPHSLDITYLEPPLPRFISPDPLTEVVCESSIEPESQKLREMRAHTREINRWKLEDTEKEQKECTSLLREITAGKKLCIPKGWKVLVADVVVIGAGAAGMKCVDTLTKRSKELQTSSNALESDITTSPFPSQPPLRVIQLEGRSRIGGRIDTRRIQRLGEKPFCIERGAAFVHGCDPEGHNPAFNIALQYNLPRAYKNDAIDGWLSHGATLPSAKIDKLRDIYNNITEEDMMEYICRQMTRQVFRLRGGGCGFDGHGEMSDVESKEEIEVNHSEYDHGSDLTDNESMHDFADSRFNSSSANDASVYDAFSINYFDYNTPPSSVPAINPEFAAYAASLATLPTNELDSEHDVTGVASPEHDSPPPLQSPLPISTLTVSSVINNNNEVKVIDLLNDEDHNIDYEDEGDDGKQKARIEKHNSSKSKKRKHRSHDIYVGNSAGVTATRRLKDSRKSRRGLSASTSSPSSSASPSESYHHRERKRRRKQEMYRQSHNSQEESDSSDESGEADGDDEDDVDEAYEDGNSEDEAMSDNDCASERNNRAAAPKSDAKSSDSDGEAEMVLTPLKPAGDYDYEEQRAGENRRRILKRKEKMNKDAQEKKRLTQEKINAKNRERRKKKGADRLARKQKKDQGEKRARIDLQAVNWKPEHDESHQSVYEKCVEFRKEQEKKCAEDARKEQEKKCTEEFSKKQEKQLLSENDLRLLESLHYSQHGYVAPLSKLSCFDGMQSAGFNGGERYLPNGYDEVIHILHQKALHRSTRENASCRYSLLLNHTVKCIEQPQYSDQSISSSSTSSSSNSYAIIHCPSNHTLIITRFVVSTLSVGLMHSSIRYQDEMEVKYGKMLQVNLKGATTEGKIKEDVEMNGSGSSRTSVADESLQQHAAILFSPPLHAKTSSEFLSLGMGLENKIIMVYPVASRFFPNHMHMLRSVKYPSWRFYNMHSIAQGKDLAVLVAHRPPIERPTQQQNINIMNEEDVATNYLSSYDLETLPREAVLQHVMKVLHDMFTPDKEEAKRREVKQDQRMLKRMKNMGIGDDEKEKMRVRVRKEKKEEESEAEEPFEETIEEPILPQESDEEAEYSTFVPSFDNNDITPLHSQQQQQADQTPLIKKSTKIEWTFEHPRDDHRWQSRPVVPPLMFEITRWSRDPYSLGAYSYIPVGCNALMGAMRLHQFEPPRQTSSLCDMDSLMSDLINSASSSSTSLSASVAQTEGVLLFAGEALAVLDKQQVHGAMESGEKAAGRIIERMKAEKSQKTR